MDWVKKKKEVQFTNVYRKTDIPVNFFVEKNPFADFCTRFY